MPFSTTASIISTDMDNNLRGLFRDNADHAVTGTVAETDLASFSVPGNTIGATGALHINVGGTFTGSAGLKTVKGYFGGTLLFSLTTNGVADPYWTGEIWIYNTSTATQRITYRMSCSNSSGVVTSHLSASLTAAKDTTQNQIVKTTTTNVSAADTTTQQTMDVFVVQIT